MAEKAIKSLNETILPQLWNKYNHVFLQAVTMGHNVSFTLRAISYLCSWSIAIWVTQKVTPLGCFILSDGNMKTSSELEWNDVILKTSSEAKWRQFDALFLCSSDVKWMPGDALWVPGDALWVPSDALWVLPFSVEWRQFWCQYYELYWFLANKGV